MIHQRIPKEQRVRKGSIPGVPEVPPFALVPKRRRQGVDTFMEHRTEILAQARELGLYGATDFEAAQALGISEMTLNQWKARHEDFRAALQIAKDIADGRIEAMLYHKAHGYTYRSEKVFCTDGVVTRVPVLEHVPPSDTAMIFWLKNRQRERWRDEKQISGEVDVNVNHTGDLREIALAMVATIQAGMAAPMIEGEATRTEEGNGT